MCIRDRCNAYSELNDPIDQLERVQEQLRLSENGDDEAMFIDMDFVRALEYGMPSCSGNCISSAGARRNRAGTQPPESVFNRSLSCRHIAYAHRYNCLLYTSLSRNYIRIISETETENKNPAVRLSDLSLHR